MADQASVTYTSHPIQRFRMGKFRFEKGMLVLTDSAEIAEFEACLEALPQTERIRIKKIDLAAAEKISEEIRKTVGGATQQTDSTIGDKPTAPKQGTGDLVKDNPGEKAVESALGLKK